MELRICILKEEEEEDENQTYVLPPCGVWGEY